jgi:hypothetical protein
VPAFDNIVREQKGDEPWTTRTSTSDRKRRQDPTARQLGRTRRSAKAFDEASNRQQLVVRSFRGLRKLSASRVVLYA